MSASAKLRVLRCLWILLSGWHTKSQVAEQLGVCTRSVGRYLANIQDAGFSVQVAGDEGPYEQLYRVERDVFYEPANEPACTDDADDDWTNEVLPEGGEWAVIEMRRDGGDAFRLRWVPYDLACGGFWQWKPNIFWLSARPAGDGAEWRWVTRPAEQPASATEGGTA